MRRGHSGAARGLVVLCACARASAPAQQPESAWRELTSDHFVIDTDLPSDVARKLAAQLEFSRAGLVHAILGGKDERRPRLDVVAFATQRGFEPYRREENIAAFFNGTSPRAVIVFGPFSGGGPSENDFLRAVVASHELVHYLLPSRVPLQPRWFEEGMAEFYFSGSRPPGPYYTTGLADLVNIRALETGLLPVRKVLGWNSPPQRALYANGWLLVHYLSNRHPDALRAFEARLANFEAPDQAWNAAFPAWSLKPPGQPERLDGELEAYRRNLDKAGIVFPTTASAEAAERMLSPAEAIVAPLKIYRKWGPGELRSELDRALALDPANVQALRLLADESRADAEDLGAQAVNAHPEDPAAWHLRAESLAGKKQGAEKECEESFRRALELAPDDAETAFDFATFLHYQKRPREALPYLQQAQRAEPWWPLVYLMGALVHGQLLQCPEAAADTARYARMLGSRGVEFSQQDMQALAKMTRLCNTLVAP